MSCSSGARTICCGPPFIGSFGAFSGVMIASTPGIALRRIEVEADDRAGADRALHQHRVHDIRYREFGGVVARPVTFSRPSTRSMPCPMLAMGRSSRQADAVCNARSTARRNRICLNPFCLAGRAPSPAARRCIVQRGIVQRLAAQRGLHFRQTPWPRADAARRDTNVLHVPSRISSATAADTSANSKLARSRSFR